jgi:hypothetical protein
MASASDQNLENLMPLRRHLEPAGEVAPTKPRTSIMVVVAPVTPAWAHSLPLARQNSRTRSGTSSWAAMVEASSIGAMLSGREARVPASDPRLRWQLTPAEKGSPAPPAGRSRIALPLPVGVPDDIAAGHGVGMPSLWKRRDGSVMGP